MWKEMLAVCVIEYSFRGIVDFHRNQAECLRNRGKSSIARILPVLPNRRRP
jgi:hypothetical protein